MRGPPREVVPIVFRFGRLGDMVMLTALLQLLRQRYGSPCEVFASGPWNSALFAGHPEVFKLWTLRRHVPVALCASWWKAWWRLRSGGRRPVYVSEYRPRQLRRIRWLLWLAGMRREHCVFITQMPGDAESHWLDRLVSFGALTPTAFSGVPMAAAPADRVPLPRIQVTLAELAAAQAWLDHQGQGAREIILVQPGNFRTLYPRRRQRREVDDKAWPVANWATLLQRLADARPAAALLVCGAPQEAAMIERIVAAVGHARVFAAALPLRSFFALCRLAHSMVSIDTGPAHVAAALGVPLTVMYGAESPNKWLPRSADGSVVMSVGGPPRSRVSEVSVDEVFECWQASIHPPIMGTFLISKQKGSHLEGTSSFIRFAGN